MRVHLRWLSGAGLAASALLVAGALWPANAVAHGFVGRAYLPVPAWLFAWAAGAVLILSFLALGAMWSSPRLQGNRGRRRFGIPPAVRIIAGAFGALGFAVVVYSGVTGSQIPTTNLVPTAVFVLFWVGLPVASALVGDIFALLSPWLAVARAARWLLGTGLARRRLGNSRLIAPLPYPEALGRWPAVAGILAFAWLELIFTGRQHPATLAVLAVGYALVQLVGMALYGIEAWTERGDAFAVVFNLFARLSPVEIRTDSVCTRPPLAGLTEVRPLPGTVALLIAMIGTTTFDGFLNGPVWRAVAPSLQRDLGHLGLGGTASLELAMTAGMAVCVLLCAGLYWIGVRGMSGISQPAVSGVAHPRRPLALARAFAPSLAPIAFGYLLAHYFSLLITQGQATASLISDPTGTGANLFGTAGAGIDYGIVSAAVIWYVQVAALVGGHVSGLALAHDRALVLYGDSRAAAESQRWMLVVMVTFTCLGLWLLSAVNT